MISNLQEGGIAHLIEHSINFSARAFRICTARRDRTIKAPTFQTIGKKSVTMDATM